MKRPSRHLSVSEVICRCGKCKLAYIREELAEGFEMLRELVGDELCADVPIDASSGFRCTAHNESLIDFKTKKRLSSPFSRHMIGEALDLKTPEGLTVNQFAALAEKVPQFANGGIGIYSWGIHVDVRGWKARWDRRGK